MRVDDVPQRSLLLVAGAFVLNGHPVKLNKVVGGEQPIIPRTSQNKVH